MRAMKFQQEVYDGTDFVFEVIENVERYIDREQAGSLLESDSSSESASGTREGSSTAFGAAAAGGTAGGAAAAGSTFINTRPQHFHSGTKPSAETNTPVDGTQKRQTPTSSTKNRPHSHNSTNANALRHSFAWQALLLRKPKLYLRLVLHVDVAFCEGRTPEEGDFPGALRRIG